MPQLLPTAKTRVGAVISGCTMPIEPEITTDREPLAFETA